MAECDGEEWLKAMEVDLEMTGGVPARMKCSMAQDVVRGLMFIAEGDRGEPTW